MKKKELEKKKKFIMELLKDPIYQPMRLREIASLLRLDKGQKKELYEVMDSLLEEGKISLDKKGRYEKASKSGKKTEKKKREKQKKEKLTGRKKSRETDRIKYDEDSALEGTFIGHPKGFGFVEIPDQEEDIFIPEEKTGTALHQDKVRIIVEEKQKEGKRKEGTVVKVLERGMPQIVGTYQCNRDFGFVICDNPKFSKDVFISKKDSNGRR